MRAKWIGIAIGAVLVACAAICLIAAWLVALPGEEPTPYGIARDTSYYVPMRDGTRIAVELWLPSQLRSAKRLPTLIRATRYWRQADIGLFQRIVYGLHLVAPEHAVRDDTEMFNRAGFAVVLIDARGSGASFGRRLIEWSPREISDYGQVMDWIVHQRWSDRRLGAWGVSYDGNAADLMATLGKPQLRAVAPLYDDFDPTSYLGMPGGVRTSGFLHEWSEFLLALDQNDVCALEKVHGIRCWLTRLYSSGVEPVDGNSRTLAAAVTSRRPYNFEKLSTAARFRDDLFGNSGLTFDEVSPFRHIRAYNEYRTPMQVWVSWLDAGTVQGALARFLSLDVPQQVFIGAYTHGGRHDADPFHTAFGEPNPSRSRQYAILSNFFRDRLEGGAAGGKIIFYYTLGSPGWRRTKTWPPPNLSPMMLWLDGPKNLAGVQKSAPPDRYLANFSATTGLTTRWSTQMGGTSVNYGNRASADRNLLTYTTTPLLQTIEVTGTPVLDLWLSSSRKDCAIHAYLEDVAPSGRVTYVTEGLLRCSARGVGTNPYYRQPEPFHPMQRADFCPMPEWRPQELKFGLFATSVLFKKGHSIRLAISAADEGTFERVPADGPLRLYIWHDAGHPSRLELPSAPVTTGTRFHNLEDLLGRGQQ